MAALNSTQPNYWKIHCGLEKISDQEQRGFCFFPTDNLVKNWYKLHVCLLSKLGVKCKKSAWKTTGPLRTQWSIQFNGVRLLQGPPTASPGFKARSTELAQNRFFQVIEHFELLFYFFLLGIRKMILAIHWLVQKYYLTLIQTVWMCQNLDFWSGDLISELKIRIIFRLKKKNKTKSLAESHKISASSKNSLFVCLFVFHEKFRAKAEQNFREEWTIRIPKF